MEQLWRPLSKRFAHAALGLDPNKQYVLSGSAGGSPHLKGEDLLLKAMARVAAARGQEIEILIFGQFRPLHDQDWPCRVHWLGPVRDPAVLSMLAASAGFFMLPHSIRIDGY